MIFKPAFNFITIPPEKYICLLIWFQVGAYVIEKKDMQNYETYPIWRLEPENMMRKFEMKIEGGTIRHHAVETVSRMLSAHLWCVTVVPRVCCTAPWGGGIEGLRRSKNGGWGVRTAWVKQVLRGTRGVTWEARGDSPVNFGNHWRIKMLHQSLFLFLCQLSAVW